MVDRRSSISYEGDGAQFLNATWEMTSDIAFRIEAVHRLTDLGAVIAFKSYATSEKGFAAEWRALNILTIEGDLISRGEIFDESELDTAIARFDELASQERRLENAATRAWWHAAKAFNRRDLDDLFTVTREDGRYEDRRKGLRYEGMSRRDVIQEVFTAPKSWRLTVEALATRGSRLALSCARFRDSKELSQPITTEALTLTEVAEDGFICNTVHFDLDDIDSAFAELDARYLAGEAQVYAKTWSAIAKAYAMFQRGELASTTEDWVSIDHRLLSAPLDAQSRAAYVHAVWDQTPNLTIRIEAVHRLTSLGAVVAHITRGTSQDGFEAEWHDVNLLTLDGELINRSERFNETDLDAALARFDELGRQAPEDPGHGQISES